MFVILYYDVGKKRCVKMLKTCRRYLTWVQNSVFEGEISNANYAMLTNEMEEIISENKDTDSIVVYKFRTLKYLKRELFGADKKDEINFL